MQDHAPTPRSTSARWPPAGTSAGWPGRRRRRCGCSTPPAATSCWSRPSASGSPRSRSPALADTTVVLLAPGMGDGIQAAKAGHPRDRRRLRRQQGRPGRRRPGPCATCGTCSPSASGADGGRGGRRSLKTVAAEGEGVDELVEALDIAPAPRLAEAVRRARPAPTPPGARRDRGDRAHRAARALGRRARRRPSSTTSRPPWSTGEPDPYAAADELRRGRRCLTALSGGSRLARSECAMRASRCRPDRRGRPAVGDERWSARRPRRMHAGRRSLMRVQQLVDRARRSTPLLKPHAADRSRATRRWCCWTVLVARVAAAGEDGGAARRCTPRRSPRSSSGSRPPGSCVGVAATRRDRSRRCWPRSPTQGGPLVERRDRRRWSAPTSRSGHLADDGAARRCRACSRPVRQGAGDFWSRWPTADDVRRGAGSRCPGRTRRRSAVGGSSRSSRSCSSRSAATSRRWASASPRPSGDGLVASDPETFFLPTHRRPALPVGVRPPARGSTTSEMRELVVDALADVRAGDAARAARRSRSPAAAAWAAMDGRRVGRGASAAAPLPAVHATGGLDAAPAGDQRAGPPAEHPTPAARRARSRCATGRSTAGSTDRLGRPTIEHGPTRPPTTSTHADDARQARWQDRYEKSRVRDADFTTLSGQVDGRRRRTAPTDSEWPGEFPFTRGLYATGYRGRTWTIRQFAGFGNAAADQRALPDDPRPRRRRAVGRLRHADADGPRLRRPARASARSGTAVSRSTPPPTWTSLFDDIPLDEVTTSMTISGPAVPVFCMYARRRRAAGRRHRQAQRHPADRHLQGVHRAEGVAVRPRAAPAADRRPDGVLRREDPGVQAALSVSGYHIREAGSTAAQELAFTLADGFGYVELGLSRGLDIDVFAPGLSFFFDTHLDFFEEIAKFRAARRIWARWVRDVYGAKTEKAQWMRFHTQTAGVSLTAQQPYNNVVRTAHRGARRRARRHELAAHQRPRRDAGAAQRAGRRDRAAHPAGDHGGDRRRQRRRPARRLAGTSRRSPTRSRPRPTRSSTRSSRWAARR